MEVFISSGDLYIYVGVLMAYIMHVFQLSQLQAELEEEWKGKCEQMLASAKEQHSRALAELIEQRDALQDNHTQLLEKVDKLAIIKHKHTHT